MSSTQTQTMTLSTPPSTPTRHDTGQEHNIKSRKPAPSVKSPKITHKKRCTVKVLNTTVSGTDAVESFVAYLHLPQNYPREASEGFDKTAVILMSGASGGVRGPSSMYDSMADDIASLRRGIPVLRMDYRVPECNKSCVVDVQAAMGYLRKDYAISRFVLVGWGSGAQTVMSVGGMDERVVGCAAVAAQTDETGGIARVAAKSLPLLLLHGSNDETIAPACSESLLETYQRHAKDDMGFLKVFDEDDHALTRNSCKAEAMLCAFVMRCAGVEIAEDEDSVVLKRRGSE